MTPTESHQATLNEARALLYVVSRYSEHASKGIPESMPPYLDHERYLRLADSCWCHAKEAIQSLLKPEHEEMAERIAARWLENIQRGGLDAKPPVEVWPHK